MMKKFAIVLVAMLFGALQMNGQKIGYIDSKKILAAIPEYENAQKQLEALSGQYENAVKAEYAKIETLYNRYQQQKGNLTAQGRQMRENEIIQKEQEVKQMQKEYFGEDGAMQKYSEQLLGPIRERVDAAVKILAKQGNYMLVMDVASMQGVAYSDQTYDLSAQIIKILGY